jgi:hypothetical protein
LAVEQIATQKRDQTTTAQDVKRDVATRRETSKPNDENDSDVNSRQTSTSARRDKRDSASRWKTAALAWFGSFAIFCAVATLTFALTRDASPTQIAATQTVASTVPASDVPQIAPPTPTQNAEPQAIAFEEPAFDDQTSLNATPAEESQAVETTQTLADASFAPSEPTIYRKKISDVKIGERAVGVNPQGATPGEDDAIFERVKHCGYKLCYLKENGTTCEIELLRPVDWLDYERVQLRRKTDGKVLDELDFAVADLLSTSVAPPVATTNNVAPSTADELGAAATNDGESPNLAGLNDVASPIIVDFTPAYDVEIWLELPEMGVLGWATLTDVDENVAIQPGSGAVVTGTFAHISDAVIDLQIEGQPKPIGCTTTHPFWSVDRQDFVEAGRLQQGERVQLYNGETKRVVQKLPRPGPVNVYNLEVYAEHVYRATPDGVLTHNNGCSSDDAADLLKANHRKGMRFEAEVRKYYGVKKKENIKITQNGNTRYPDIIIEEKIDGKIQQHFIEVKNVKRLNLTAQINDFIEYAYDKGIIFTIVVKNRQDLKISKPLQKKMNKYNFPIKKFPE